MVDDHLLLALARRRARPDYIAEGGSMICAVPAGWPAAILKEAADLRIANDALEMAEALQDPATHEIFIPAGAALTRSLIEKRCAAASAAKIIYCESGHA